MKKFNKIVLAGGSGYLGKVLAKHYMGLANEVIILARQQQSIGLPNIQTVLWDGKTEGDWSIELENADLLINLCGKNVNCRYTSKNRQEIIYSRVGPTRLLNRVIEKMINPPKVWINITSATIYRHAEDHEQDESTGEIGYGVSVEVCRQWEESFFETQLPNTRKIALRMGIVLGRSGGAFPRLLTLAKFGMGGKQGDGKQYISWIHEQDAALSTQWILENEAIKGRVNCTSPNAITNREFMQKLRAVYGIYFGLPCPTWMLTLGARLIGTETELILKSRWVAPKLLVENGFKFQYPKLDSALRDLMSLRL
jgi:uncharacterized protein